MVFVKMLFEFTTQCLVNFLPIFISCKICKNLKNIHSEVEHSYVNANLNTIQTIPDPFKAGSSYWLTKHMK